MDEEFVNLLAISLHAATRGPAQATWLLASSLHGYLRLRMRTVDWLTIAQAGLAAAKAAGDLKAQAACQFSLGDRDERMGANDSAASHYTTALELAEQADWLEGQAGALGSLGVLSRQAGRLREGARLHLKALELTDDPARFGVWSAD